MPVAKDHSPNGYNSVRAQVIESLVTEEKQITLLSCKRCGALVLMYHTHDSWHKEQEKKPSTSRGKW